MTDLKRDFMAYLLRKQGLFYYGTERPLEEEVREHRPEIYKQAEELMQIVADKLGN